MTDQSYQTMHGSLQQTLWVTWSKKTAICAELSYVHFIRKFWEREPLSISIKYKTIHIRETDNIMNYAIKTGNQEVFNHQSLPVISAELTEGLFIWSLLTMKRQMILRYWNKSCLWNETAKVRKLLVLNNKKDCLFDISAEQNFEQLAV